MNAKLADALDEAARRIETSPSRYVWGLMHTCNCGVLAQVVMGIGQTELGKLFDYDQPKGNFWNGDWSQAGRNVACEITGLPVGTILRTLGDAGLSYDDLGNLEHLSDERVLAEMGVDELDYEEGTNAAKYLRAWSRLIRREHEQQKSMDAADVIASKHRLREPVLV